MEIADVRRRVRGAIENARKESAERRERSDGAAKAYTLFLERQAVPTFRLVAVALTGEGLRFNVSTPAESVRLSSEGNAEDYLELALDSSQDPPAVMGRTSRGRGRRAFTSERPVRDGAAVGELTDEDVLEFLVAGIGTLVER